VNPEPCGWCRGVMGDDGLCTVCHEPERDWYGEYKDGVAMGYINEDGTQRDEPGEPDWEPADA